MHTLRGLDGEASRVEGDALADQAYVGERLLVLGRIVHEDAHRRIHAAAVDGQQGVEALGFERGLVERANGVAVALAAVFGPLGQGLRLDLVAGLVDQVENAHLRGGHLLGAPGDGLGAGDLAFRRVNLQAGLRALEGRRFVVFGFVEPGLVTAQKCAVDRGFERAREAGIGCPVQEIQPRARRPFGALLVDQAAGGVEYLRETRVFAQAEQDNFPGRKVIGLRLFPVGGKILSEPLGGDAGREQFGRQVLPFHARHDQYFGRIRGNLVFNFKTHTI